VHEHGERGERERERELG
jgi:hypothetical protein